MHKTNRSDPREVRRMVQRIVRQFHPERVILFVSHARGDAGPDSDVDLRVVMPASGSKRRQASEIDRVLADRRLPLDLIVVTPEEFDAYKDVVGHILYPAVRERKLLYEKAA